MATFTAPCFDDSEKKALSSVIDTGWLVQGTQAAEFERLFAEYTGARFAKAAASCTTALHLVLDALWIKAGDKVIVPSFTYIASANAVEYTGAKELKKDKAGKIRAIMPVNLFGLCADLPELVEIAVEYNVAVNGY